MTRSSRIRRGARVAAALGSLAVLLQLAAGARPAFAPAKESHHGRDGHACTIQRYDSYPVQDPDARPGFYPVCEEDLPTPRGPPPFAEARKLRDPAAGVRNNYAGPHLRKRASPFTIQFTCGVADQALCAKALQGYANAGSRIDAAISITQPIVVDAKFISFCAVYNKCNTNILGQAGPSAQYSVSWEGGTYFIPQALHKNSVLYGTATYNTFDLHAEFNSDFAWWFQGDPAITSSQEDFEGVVMHEFVHGLGFLSGWAMYFSGTYLTPTYYVYSDGTWAFWGKQYIYDKFLYDVPAAKYFSTYYDSIVTTYPGTAFTPVSTVQSGFQTCNCAGFTSASRVYTVAAGLGSKKASFKPAANTFDATSSYIWTSTSYYPGTALAHFDDSYVTTPNFLQISYSNPGQTLDQKIASTGKYIYGTMGPRLLAALQSIGWVVKPPPTFTSTTTSRTSTTSTRTTSTKSTTTTRTTTSRTTSTKRTTTKKR